MFFLIYSFVEYLGDGSSPNLVENECLMANFSVWVLKFKSFIMYIPGHWSWVVDEKKFTFHTDSSSLILCGAVARPAVIEGTQKLN